MFINIRNCAQINSVKIDINNIPTGLGVSRPFSGRIEVVLGKVWNY